MDTREAGVLLVAVLCLGEVVEIYLRAPCRAEVEKRVVIVGIMVFCGVEVESEKVLKFFLLEDIVLDDVD